MLIINITLLSFKLLASFFCNSNYDLNEEIVNLLAKIGKVLALS